MFHPSKTKTAVAMLVAAAVAAPGASARPSDVTSGHQQPAIVNIGDTPVDYPGASRAPQYTRPTTIQVVRPERTIVRDVNDVLPVVVSSAALLIAAAGSGFLLLGTVRRRRLGSSH